MNKKISSLSLEDNTPSQLSENEDWQVTREIYSDAIVQETDDRATLHIQISLANMVAIRVLTQGKGKGEPDSDSDSAVSTTDADLNDNNAQEQTDEFQIKPRFEYVQLSHLEDPPIVEITVHYPTTENDCYPDAVSVSLLQYPKIFPISLKEPWSKWMSSKATELLAESMLSFSVCNFVEHEVMEFFETIDSIMHGFSAIVFRAELFGYYEMTSWESKCMDSGDTTQHDNTGTEKKLDVRSVHDIRLRKKLPTHTPSIHKFARQALKRNWKQFYEYTCPICFSPETCDKGVELPCDHFYCKECIGTYVKVIIDGIQMHRTNPFICPITECKANMNVFGSPCKEIRSCDILTEEQRDVLTLWRKDIEYPPSTVLTTCPLSSCGATGMRMLNNHKSNTFVKCETETCGAVFCELCLKRIKRNKVGFDHREECDETTVLKLLKRYQRASPEIQAKCDDRLKWIRDYASSREIDASLALWLQEFASVCPNCKNGIERSDGCFHMHCITCGTHFCYECGEEIFFPFYGTHHCWEREIDEIQFALFD